MSNVQAEKAELDQLAKLQQMKLNARLTALEVAMKLMNTPNYSVVFFTNDPDKPNGDSVPHVKGGTVDALTLLAVSMEVESYILGNIEKESTDAIAQMKARLAGPKIVRP